MKKIILILFVSFFALKGFAQSEAKIVEEKAKSWFKKVYVELNFKDPYSYELLKIDVFPVTYQSRIEEMLRIADQDLNSLDTTRYYGDYQVAYREYQEAKRIHDSRFKSSSDSIAIKVSLSALAYKYRPVKALSDKYKKVLEDKKTLQEALDTLSESDLLKVIRYKIYIDCYAKNSYGNKVLGEYVFATDPKGEVIEEPRQMN